MARPLRVEYAGAFYHVINQGNAGEKIFKSPSDKEKFLEYLQKTVNRFSLILHTYCLMGNHYHLLVETPKEESKGSHLHLSLDSYKRTMYGNRGSLMATKYSFLLC
ncbi:MAG: transposase [Pseudomonadota bacterium]